MSISPEVLVNLWRWMSKSKYYQGVGFRSLRRFSSSAVLGLRYRPAAKREQRDLMQQWIHRYTGLDNICMDRLRGNRL